MTSSSFVVSDVRRTSLPDTVGSSALCRHRQQPLPPPHLLLVRFLSLSPYFLQHSVVMDTMTAAGVPVKCGLVGVSTGSMLKLNDKNVTTCIHVYTLNI